MDPLLTELENRRRLKQGWKWRGSCWSRECTPAEALAFDKKLAEYKKTQRKLKIVPEIEMKQD